MAVAKELPELNELKRLFRLNKKIGILHWKVTVKGGVHSGETAGYKNAKGYIIVMINKGNYRAHRIIWKMVTGIDPGNNQIDHINMKKSDNRLRNLRLADNSKNHANTILRKDNSTGYKGVYLIANCPGLWQAKIKNINLGYFRDIIEAAQAYDSAAAEIYGEFARTNF